MKINLNNNSILVASQNQVSADLSSDVIDSIVILHLKDGVYYELKEVGALVWSLVQQPCSIQSILNRLLEEYDVDAGQCESDLHALIEDLVKFNLVENQSIDITR